MPAGAGPANPGAPSPGVYPRGPPPQLASAGALPQRRRLASPPHARAPARRRPRAAKDGHAGGSRARQPRAPLTRCLPEVPPASARLRRRAPAAPPPRTLRLERAPARRPSGGKRRACRREQGPPTPGPPHQVSIRGAPRLGSPPPARSRAQPALPRLPADHRSLAFRRSKVKVQCQNSCNLQ